ncbi:MAG: iron-sulfur cluster repair di-iron protein [Cyclobacteriaceae bacterium]|nr:iron-sulfur cluster repair di-iron protein [Cyclobacteriaceae bacterium]MDH4294775.1 iron-sulfur cluster repair di-iron protein [Cyclobacteriaceae bacterium]MDH5248624.1 iron-sulfur cluster repair di-iron protein [Cyclobacteriaceae bacterium]
MITVANQLDLENMTVADVALRFPRALVILNRYNLDYCCGGRKPFVQTCEKAELDAAFVWQEIQRESAGLGVDNHMNFGTWDPSVLIDFIVQHHHGYVRDSIPRIQEMLDKVCEVHREDSPFLLEVHDDFDRLAEELLGHLPKEEEILFPAARKLFKNGITENMLRGASLHLEAPIAVMEHEHENAGRLIKSIRTLTANYSPPEYACPTFKLTYTMLQEFDKDLMQHIHLENNILFPNIIKAQEQRIHQ